MMTDRQVAFFRALLEPFPDHAYKSMNQNGRNLTYIKARTIKNRLDDIVGPIGWAAEYTATERGYKCRLKILCPDHTEDGWAWHYKEDGGGQEDMGSKNKATGEWEVDKDNDEKAAYTNAFRRAAGEWGFGRDLYGEGVPRWLADLYPNAGVCTPADAPPPIGQHAVEVGNKVSVSHGASPSNPGRMEPVPRQESLPQPTPVNGHIGQRPVNLKPPTSSKGIYPWIKDLEKHYGVEMAKGVSSHCTKLYGSWDTRNLNNVQAGEVIDWLVHHIKSKEFYNGEFDPPPEDFPDKPAPMKPPETALKSPSGVQSMAHDLGPLKRAILAAAKVIVEKQTGRESTIEEQCACVGDMAAGAKNCSGHTGEVLEGLKTCQDRIWLNNIKDEAQRQMLTAAMTPKPATAATATAIDEFDDMPDIPF